MPIKEKLQLISGKPAKEDNNPGAEHITGEPVAEFKIDDQLYLIFPDGGQKGSGLNQQDASYTDYQNANIMGELKINKRRYIIVQSDLCQKEDFPEGLRNSLDILTKRELQIVMLVAEGLVNKQVAGRLKISEWTVSTHLRRIFAKLKVDNRAAMVYRCSDLIEQTHTTLRHMDNM